MLVKKESGQDALMLESLKSRNCNEVLFFPLYGQDNSTECLSSVLHINGQNILLDCGWNEECDVAMLAPLAVAAPYIDVVLISHADVAHTGALPYAIAHLGLKSNRVYCTLPVQHLGHLALYELLAGRHDVSDFNDFSFDDIDVAFEAIKGVRFGQQIILSESGLHESDSKKEGNQGLGSTEVNTLKLTALPAGHSLGGAVWQVSLLDQDFVYAVSINLKADLHLQGCSLHSEQHRPALLVTDCSGHSDPPADQGDVFCRTVAAAVRKRTGHVLIPVDSTARVLELLVLLDQHWESNGLSAYPIVLLARTALSTLMKARAQLEFMSEAVQKKFSRGRGGHPLELKHVHATSHVEALSTLPNNSHLVVLAPLASLDIGPARQLFLDCAWASDPGNTIILPLGAGSPGSLTSKLTNYAATTIQSLSPLVMEVGMSRRVPLTQEELEERKAADEANNQPLEGGEDAEMKDLSKEEAADAGGDDAARVSVEPLDHAPDDFAAGRGHTTAIAQQVAGGGHTHVADTDGAGCADSAFEGTLIDGFRVPEGAVCPMFPGPEKPPEWDEFGAKVDLLSLFGQDHHRDDVDSDMEATAADDALLHGGVEMATLDLHTSKVIHERKTIRVNAHIMVFDFRSLISQSSFVSMVRHVAPRNLVLMRRAVATGDAVPLLDTVHAALKGGFSRILTPGSGEVVSMASVAAYAASMTQQLSQLVEHEPKTTRGVYQLGWLDAIVKEISPHSGALVLDIPPVDQQDMHTRKGAYLGNMMVSDLTQRLREKKLPVEQEGEVAKVGEGDDPSVVVFQRDQESRNTLVIEGDLSHLYYKVRDEVYQQCRLVPH